MNDTEWVWRKSLYDNFPALRGVSDFGLNAACSMHIHIRPVEGWDRAGVKLCSLLRATAVYDDAITKIMPAEYKQTPWAKSSFREFVVSEEEVTMKPKLTIH